MMNPFRPVRLMSLRRKGEVHEACHHEGLCSRGRGRTGGWGRNAGKVGYVKQGDPRGTAGESRPVEVGAPIGAMKRGNARRAKGRRKVEAEWQASSKTNRRE